MTKADRFFQYRMEHMPDFFLTGAEIGKHGFTSEQIKAINAAIGKRMERHFRKQSQEISAVDFAEREASQSMPDAQGDDEKALSTRREYGYSALTSSHFQRVPNSKDDGDNRESD